MGMVMYLRRATVTEIERLRAKPQAAGAFMFPDEDDDLSPPSLVDFDKAWHALHFTLAGQPYGPVRPLGVISGEDAEELGKATIGESPFWVIEAEVMAEFANALDRLTDDDIVARCDPAGMLEHDIYLADVFADEDDPALDYLMQGVPDLRRFAALCRQNGEGAIRALA